MVYVCSTQYVERLAGNLTNFYHSCSLGEEIRAAINAVAVTLLSLVLKL
jgi:hypothetical protein